MRYVSLGIGFMFALGLMAVLPAQALADSPGVLLAVVIDTNGDDDALLAEAENNEKIFERLGIKATRRYLRASLAGSQTGAMVVSIDYPSLVAYAPLVRSIAGAVDEPKHPHVLKDILHRLGTHIRGVPDPLGRRRVL